MLLERRKKQRPLGEEVQRALPVLIGNREEELSPIRIGSAGRRSALPTDALKISPDP